LVPSQTQKIIYFDQNAWIDLAKIYYGSPNHQEKNLLEKILNASKEETTVFPISIVHLGEINKIQRMSRRTKLAQLMAQVSKGYTVIPYWNRIIDLEVENLVRDLVKIPKIDIKKYWLGKGVSQLIGMKPNIVDDGNIPKEQLNQLNKALEESLVNTKTVELLLAYPHYFASHEKDAIEAIEIFEKNRVDLQEFKDKDFRFRVFLARNALNTIGPRISRILIKYNLPPKILEIILPKDGFNEFLERIPTAMCEFYLLYFRDQQLQRPIQVNDSLDIWHLTLGIPYSDIVVTENMWTSICYQSKLNEKCNTIILNSINELIHYL